MFMAVEATKIIRDAYLTGGLDEFTKSVKRTSYYTGIPEKELRRMYGLTFAAL
jgi:hypothetical protein